MSDRKSFEKTSANPKNVRSGARSNSGLACIQNKLILVTRWKYAKNKIKQPWQSLSAHEPRKNALAKRSMSNHKDQMFGHKRKEHIFGQKSTCSEESKCFPNVA